MSKVLWTPLAIESLQKTTDFIASNWSQQVLDNFLTQLDFRIDQISNNPELAPALPESNFRRLQIHKNVSLFYSIAGDSIKLLLVWDNRQNPLDLFNQINLAQSE